MKSIAERLAWALVGALCLLVAAVVARAADAGPLDQPGPPASTRPLVEPRIPISQPASPAGFPITISQPGSYYLTGTITDSNTGGAGIEITVSDVTLDLNGFAVIGPGGSDVTSSGIAVSGARTGIAVRNGLIHSWGGYGVLAYETSGSRFEDLTVTDNGLHGLLIGSGNTAARISSRRNQAAGIMVMQVSDNWGSIIEDSNFSRNTGSGVVIDANNVVVRDSVLDSNAVAGVYLMYNRSHNEIVDNRVTGNGTGIYLESLGGYFPVANVVVRNVIGANTYGAYANNGSLNLGGTEWENLFY